MKYIVIIYLLLVSQAYSLSISEFKHDPQVNKYFNRVKDYRPENLLRMWEGSLVLDNQLGRFYIFNDSLFREQENSAYIYNTSGKKFKIFGEPPGLWLGKFEFMGDSTSPAKPNCTEDKLTIDDILKIANNNNVHSVKDFISELPQSVLQKFTFIHNTKSLQKGVSLREPRVLRFSTDGSISLTYILNKESKNYNTVEVIYFNEVKRKYDFYHISFPLEHSLETQLTNREKKLITKNHMSCLGCHNGFDPRPNWASYPEWDGVYGTFDDQLEQTTKYYMGKIDLNKSFGNTEDYKDFRNFQKNNFLISSLPWPTLKNKNNEIYPYIRVNKFMNYNFRPNAHYTLVQSRRNAQRLARKLEETEDWEYVKNLVGMFAIGCNLQNTSIFQELLQKKILSSSDSHYNIGAQNFLYRLGEINNFNNLDWNLNFSKEIHLNNRKSFEYHTGQWDMTEFVYSILYSHLIKDSPILRENDFRVNRMSNLFGEKFRCVDEIADKIMISEKMKKLACGIFKNNQIKIQERPDFKNYLEKKNIMKYKEVKKKIYTAKELLQSKCASCHNGSVLQSNFSNKEILIKQLKYYGDDMISKIESKLGTESQCEMPYPLVGKCLTKTEKSKLIEYLKIISK